MPLLLTFDVNDARLRTTLLTESLPLALNGLHEECVPDWGRMSPQQMVEHLAWAFDLSTGAQHTESPLTEHRRERMKAFLYTNQASPREFMNPVLVSGLPSLRHPNLSAAKHDLTAAASRFLEQPISDNRVLHVHPVFGPIGREEWSRSHFKHVFHHLLQFRLVAPA